MSQPTNTHNGAQSVDATRNDDELTPEQLAAIEEKYDEVAASRALTPGAKRLVTAVAVILLSIISLLQVLVCQWTTGIWAGTCAAFSFWFTQPFHYGVHPPLWHSKTLHTGSATFLYTILS